jgi:hypothetical protein
VINYGDKVWAWDNGCARAAETEFTSETSKGYVCLGEVFDNIEAFDGGSNKVTEILRRKEND